MLCYWSFLVCFWRCLGIFLKLCWICSFIFSWYFYYTCWNLIPSWTCKPDESYVQRHSYHRYHRHADISCSHHRFSNRVEKRRALHSVLYLSILCVCLVFNIIHSLRSESSKRLHGFLSRLRKYTPASQILFVLLPFTIIFPCYGLEVYFFVYVFQLGSFPTYPLPVLAASYHSTIFVCIKK